MSSYVCYFDGACKGNPGIGSYGFCIFRNKHLITEQGGFVGRKVTSNIAEYIAFIELLRYLNNTVLNDDEAIKRITILGDSILVVNQIVKPKIKSKVLKRYHIQARREFKHLQKQLPCTKIAVRWISRKQNRRADKIAKTYRIHFEHVLCKDQNFRNVRMLCLTY